MADPATLLIIEDEKIVRNFLSALLESSGYRVIEAGSGREALSLAPSHCPDLILLDLGLPDLDGMAVLGRLREWSATPVIVLSARDREHDKVQALDHGADDYVTKPFSNAELLARVRTALRRPAIVSSGADRPLSVFRSGGLTIDFEQRLVAVDGRDVHVTPVEFRVLTLLATSAGRVLTHERLLKTLWGPYASDNQILRVNMANIRRKLEENPADPQYILTEVGVGYRLMLHPPWSKRPGHAQER